MSKESNIKCFKNRVTSIIDFKINKITWGIYLKFPKIIIIERGEEKLEDITWRIDIKIE